MAYPHAVFSVALGCSAPTSALKQEKKLAEPNTGARTPKEYNEGDGTRISEKKKELQTSPFGQFVRRMTRGWSVTAATELVCQNTASKNRSVFYKSAICGSFGELCGLRAINLQDEAALARQRCCLTMNHSPKMHIIPKNPSGATFFVAIYGR